jgi:3-oxoacyl-[acyl-carrier protein] reductase
MEIEGKTAMVTGGSRGLGRAIAIMLAERGARVAINYRSNSEAADDTVKMIKKSGDEAKAYRADVSIFEDVQTMVNEVVDDMDTIDILVNNSGISGSNIRTGDISVEE